MKTVTLDNLHTFINDIGTTGSAKIVGRDLFTRREENADWLYAGTLADDLDAYIVQQSIADTLEAWAEQDDEEQPCRIGYRIYSAHLLDMPGTTREHVDAYSTALRTELEATFPGRDVEVEVVDRVSGSGAGLHHDGRLSLSDELKIQDIANRVLESVLN